MSGIQKPKFTAIAAVTIDGKIAGSKKNSTDWTSKEDKKFLHSFLDRSDVILVGRTTYKIAQKPLSKRNCIIFTSRVESVRKKDNRTLFCNPNNVDILTLVKNLGYKNVVILGGQKVYNFCLERGLIDEIFLTIEPIVFGRGLNFFNASDISSSFKLIKVKKLNSNGSVLLHYRLKRSF